MRSLFVISKTGISRGRGSSPVPARVCEIGVVRGGISRMTSKQALMKTTFLYNKATTPF